MRAREATWSWCRRCCRLFEIGLVGSALDPLLKRDHLVVAGRNSDGTAFQTFGHSAFVPIETRPVVGSILSVDLGRSGTGGLAGVSGSHQFAIGAREDPDFGGRHAIGETVRLRRPLDGIGEGLDDGFDAVQG
jgi:hypothetical protein